MTKSAKSGKLRPLKTKYFSKFMDIIELSAAPRELQGRGTDELREQGLVPAVVYGPKSEPVSVQVNQNEFLNVLAKAGQSSLVDLNVDGKMSKVIIQDVAYDPLKDTPIHIDFYAVDLTKPVSATVGLVFVGTAGAVKELGGTLVKARTTIEVKGLPEKLVPSLEVDISKLATFDDVIHVKDLTLPEGLEFDMDPERSIAVVNPPRTEAEIEKLDEVPEEGEAPEVEGEEPAEGEEAPAETAKEEEKKEDAGE